jgi:chitinase
MGDTRQVSIERLLLRARVLWCKTSQVPRQF